MSWNKSAKEAPEAEPKSSATPDLSALGQPASGKESASEPAAKKIPTPPELLTPAAQGFVNGQTTATTQEIFAMFHAMLEKVSLSPEKFATALAEAERLRRAPDPAVVAREQREKKMMMEDEAESRRNKERLQASCPHKYPSGGSAIQCVHNFPDRRPRGICMICQIFLEPKRWVILAPDRENPRGKPVIVDAHPLYHLVLEREAQSGA